MYGRDRKVIQNFNLKPIKEDNFGDLDVEVNTKVDLKEVGVGRCGVDSSGLGYWPVTGFCDLGIAPSGSIKYGQFLEQLSDY